MTTNFTGTGSYSEHEVCELPSDVTITGSHFAGTPVATCDACDYRCVYWDCVCELDHECKTASA